MLPLPQLPTDLRYLIGFIDSLVVPLTMVWFVFRWFWLLPDPTVETRREQPPAGETEEQKKKRVETSRWRKNYRAAPRGLTGGMIAGVLILLLFCHFYYPSGTKLSQAATTIPGCAVVLAILTGVLIGAAMWILDWKRDWIARQHPLLWGAIVTLGTGLGLAFLAIYYAGPSGYPPHDWLVWAVMSLLFVNGFELLFGD